MAVTYECERCRKRYVSPLPLKDATHTCHVGGKASRFIEVPASDPVLPQDHPRSQ